MVGTYPTYIGQYIVSGKIPTKYGTSEETKGRQRRMTLPKRNKPPPPILTPGGAPKKTKGWWMNHSLYYTVQCGAPVR